MRPSRARQLGRRALAVSLLLGAWSGCSDGSEEQSSAARPVELGTEETRAVLLAEQTLVGECMRRQGFRYEVIPATAGGDSDLKPPFGTEDVTGARSEGYRFPDDEVDSANSSQATAHSDTSQPTDPNVLYLESLSRDRRVAFERALWGPPGSPTGSVALPNGQEIGFPLAGCFSEARKRLYGNVERYMTVTTFVDNLGGEIHRRARGDADLIERLERWRACMVDRGYRFKDPGEAIEEALNDPGRERAIAVADATCARDTHLVDVGRRLYRKYQREVYAEYEGRVLAYNELVKRGVERAKPILRGS